MPRWPACRRYPASAATSPPANAYGCEVWNQPAAGGRRPTSALALAVAVGIAALDAGDPARAAGLWQPPSLSWSARSAIGGRFLGLANLAYFFSDSDSLTGFKTGAALYIASTQLPKLLGLEGGGGNLSLFAFSMSGTLLL